MKMRKIRRKRTTIPNELSRENKVQIKYGEVARMKKKSKVETSMMQK